MIEDGIVIFDEVSVMRHRMKDLFQGYNVSIYEASYDVELFNILADESMNVRLVIMDLGVDLLKGLEILSRLREKKAAIPVIILTANNKRQTFIRCMAEGASDYILKPFEDDYLLEKALSILKKKRKEFTQNETIVFDIRSYLNTEAKKAQKGRYEVTVLMCTLFDIVNEISSIVETKYIQAADKFFKNVKSILWETDIFEQHGLQTFIGVFPYCGMDNVEKINRKINDCFDRVTKEQRDVILLRAVTAAITFPTEETDAKEMLLKLGLRINDAIGELKKEDAAEERV